MMSMELRLPLILLLIPVLLGIVIFFRTDKKPPSFIFPSNFLVKTKSRSWKLKSLWIPGVLRLTVISLFIIALSGPRFVEEEQIVRSEGIDIVLAIDISGSMAAEDFVIANKRVNRLEVVKSVVNEFIDKREVDKIGLIAFAGLAYTVCPLTLDYQWLKSNLDRTQLGLIRDGTAVGAAIASSLVRLKKSKAKSRIIILLTDGVNNIFDVDPLEAAKIAKNYGVKIYTIGAGRKGYAPFPTRDIFGRSVYTQRMTDLDEETLKEIAKITEAKFFRATDTQSLLAIYEEIDRLEKTEIEQKGYFYYEEIFNTFLLGALIVLLLEIILRNSIYLRLP